MPRLIINADDLGVNTQRSHGIFTAFEFGCVTSATLLCNGTDGADAAKRARERKLPTGLHLNLTEGEPIAAKNSVETLIKADGNFHGREAMPRLFAEEAFDQVHIEREIRAQIEWFLDHHGQPTHVDGHHAISTHPVIVPILIPILLRYGIRFVRIPSEPLPPYGFQIPEDRIEKLRVICEQADAARVLFDANGIGSTDHFRGLALGGNASQKNLRHILGRLPEGTVELMVHPGSPTPIGTDFDRDPQRQTELMMLTDDRLPAYFVERKIERISYADL